MADTLFFIDTNPDEDVEAKEVEKSGTALGGKKDSRAEKLQKRRQKEENLSNFLFGNVLPEKLAKKSADKNDKLEDSGGEVADEDMDEDQIIEKPDIKDSDSSSEDESSDEEESGDGDQTDQQDSSDDDSENVMNLIPADEYCTNLQGGAGRKRKAAWHDEADTAVLVKDVAANYHRAPGKHGAKDTSTEQYSEAVKRKFKGIVGEPAWARLDSKVQDQDQDSDEEFFQETTDLFNRKSKSTRLGKDKILHRRVTDINKQTGNEGAVIRCTEFHPTSTVGLVAGLSGTASIVQVDGKTNPKIQTVNFKDFPIKTGKFSVSGEEVVVGSQHHPHFFVYDMIAGKINKISIRKKIVGTFNTQLFDMSPDGQLIALKGRFGAIHLLSARSKEYITSLKMNDECRCLTFSKSGSQLFTHGDGGEIYVWDMSTRTCTYKFVDDGCISGSSLAVNSSYLAAGSSEGVVNLYNASKLSAASVKNPKPDKVVLNLTTQINGLRFNPTGEILAMWSEMKDHAVKLLHFPSMTVFQNFPGDQTISRVNSLNFSPGSGYMAIGNNRGRALLYRLHHYKDY